MRLPVPLQKSWIDSHPYTLWIHRRARPASADRFDEPSIPTDGGGRLQEIRDDTGIRTWHIRTKLNG
jgi:hypothetical protein